MGKRGPPKKPTARHIATGSWRAGDRPDAEVEVCDSVPGAPAHLDEAGLAAWNYYGPMLVNQGVLAESDLMALEQLCTAWQRWHAARVEIEEKGTDYTDENGTWREYPHTKRAERWWDRTLKIMKEFGLTPASRPDVPRAEKKALTLAERYG